MNPTKLHLPDVSKAAKDFLAKHHPKLDLPTPIEEIIEIKMGVAVSAVPGIKDLLGIDAFIRSDFKEIVIDEDIFNRYVERTRFSLAHEIAHYVLHKDWYEKFGPKSIEDSLSFWDMVDKDTYKYGEIQANTFAGLVLVPDRPLEEEFSSLLGSEMTPPVEIEAIARNIPDLANKFCVSPETVLIRLERKGLVKKID